MKRDCTMNLSNHLGPIFILLGILLGQTKCKSYNITEYDKRCPYTSEWNIKATTTCEQQSNYYCIWDDYKKEHTEFCQDKPNLWPLGTKCVLRGNIDSEECFSERFHPFVFSTEGNSDCIYKKSLCEDKGLVTDHNGSTKDNRKCRCDNASGYSFVTTPQHNSFCNPFKEDCSCFRNTLEKSFIHSKEYNCTKDPLGCSKTERFPLSDNAIFQKENTFRIDQDNSTQLFRIIASVLMGISIIMMTGFAVLIVFTCDGETHIDLVAKPGVGKSLTVNTRLGSNYFQANDEPTTKKYTIMKGTVQKKSPPKGDWGIEIWSLGLLPTGSKTLAEVERPFGCAGCIKFAVTSGQNGDVKSDASCKESATLFAR